MLRDRDADETAGTGDLGVSGSGLEERLYATHDATYNVTALLDTTGAVKERFTYTPYGASTVRDASFVERTGGSDYDWEYRFTSRRFDGATGFYHFRNRDYSAQLGRFVGRDPLGYVDGGSLYGAYFVPGGVDPWGLFWEWVFAPIRSFQNYKKAEELDRKCDKIDQKQIDEKLALDFDEGLKHLDRVNRRKRKKVERQARPLAAGCYIFSSCVFGGGLINLRGDIMRWPGLDGRVAP